MRGVLAKRIRKMMVEVGPTMKWRHAKRLWKQILGKQAPAPAPLPVRHAPRPGFKLRRAYIARIRQGRLCPPRRPRNRSIASQVSYEKQSKGFLRRLMDAVLGQDKSTPKRVRESKVYPHSSTRQATRSERYSERHERIWLAKQPIGVH
jgi:hypothetical protein